MKAKRIFALFAVLCLALSLCGGALAESSFPLTEEPVTLRFMARTGSFYPNQDLGQVGNMIEYEKMTGVDIEWENLDPSVFDNTAAAAIASDTLPDVFFKGGLSNATLYEWGSEGILVDLKPYIEENAPNFYALMKEYPDIEQSITAPDGAIYGLPQVILAPAMRAPCKMYINTAAMEAIGMEMPTTLDELYDVLVAMRDSDFNGDGVANEVPIMSNVNWMNYTFYGCFGLMTRGAHYDRVDVDPETGKVRIFAQSENYRKYLEYMHKLYSEGLIYQEIYTEGAKNESVMAAEGRLGIILDTTLNAVPTQVMPNWTGLKCQLTGPDGDNLASYIRSNLHSTGNFAVTDACENVELALRWVDYFYSPEGSLFYHAGVEGVNWEEKEDGSLGYTQATLDSRTSDMTQDSFIGQFAMWPGGRNPAVMYDNLWGGEYEEEPAATAAALMNYASDVIWPFISWTEEENEIVNTIGSDISSFISSSSAEIISGTVELTDDWWNGFVANIDSMGGAKLISAYESALTRVYGEGNPF